MGQKRRESEKEESDSRQLVRDTVSPSPPPRRWVVVENPGTGREAPRFVVRHGVVAHWEPTRIALAFDDELDQGMPYRWFRIHQDVFETAAEAALEADRRNERRKE